MIFAKQDQIQSTLHAAIQSPSTSVFAISPPFTSPTASVAGCGTTSKVYVPPVPSPFEATDLCSLLSDSDIDSLLSFD